MSHAKLSSAGPGRRTAVVVRSVSLGILMLLFANASLQSSSARALPDSFRFDVNGVIYDVPTNHLRLPPDTADDPQIGGFLARASYPGMTGFADDEIHLLRGPLNRLVVTILLSEHKIGSTPGAFLRNLAGSLGNIEPQHVESRLDGFETLFFENPSRSRRADYVFIKRDPKTGEISEFIHCPVQLNTTNMAWCSMGMFLDHAQLKIGFHPDYLEHWEDIKNDSFKLLDVFRDRYLNRP